MKHLRILVPFTMVALGAIACSTDDEVEGEDVDVKDSDDVSVDPFDMSSVEPDQLTELEQSDRLGAVADTLREQLRVDDSLSNVFIDPPTNTITIYRVGGDAPGARALASGLPLDGAVVEYKPALLSAVEGDAFVERLTVDGEALRAAGADVHTWGPDPQGGPFRITVSGDAAQARAVIAARYPEFAARLSVEQDEAPIATYGRKNDNAPYYGGARVKMPAGSQCTSGWSVKNTREYLITASHCVPAGDKRMWNFQNRLIGSATTIARTRWDVAFFPVNTSPGIYTNTLGKADAAKTVIGVGSPPDGSAVCLSGSFEGLRCGIRIRGWVRLSLQGTTVDVWNAISTTGAVIVGQGDSGGPAFATSSGRPIARGMISMERLGTALRPCPAGSDSAGSRKCSNHAYLTDMGTLARQFNLRFSGF